MQNKLVEDIVYYLYNEWSHVYSASPYNQRTYTPIIDNFKDYLIKSSILNEHKPLQSSDNFTKYKRTMQVFEELKKSKDFIHCFILKSRGWEYAVAFQKGTFTQNNIKIDQFNKVYGSYSYLDCKPQESFAYSLEDIQSLKNFETMCKDFKNFYWTFSGLGLYFKYNLDLNTQAKKLIKQPRF
jgi:hypothetical protein